MGYKFYLLFKLLLLGLNLILAESENESIKRSETISKTPSPNDVKSKFDDINPRTVNEVLREAQGNRSQ